MAALFNAIHHVAIIASDYEKSRHFYVDLLGFEVVRENYRESRGDYKLDLKLGDCELELFGRNVFNVFVIFHLTSPPF